MAIIIQKIQINWTKRSRGNPNAAIRNSLPDKFPLNIQFAINDATYLHEISFSESDLFKKPLEKPSQNIHKAQVRELELDLQIATNQLIISTYKKNNFLKKLASLEMNSWAKIIFNQRFPYEDTWGYYNRTLNIFWGDIEKANDVFNSKKPQTISDNRKLLI